MFRKITWCGAFVFDCLVLVAGCIVLYDVCESSIAAPQEFPAWMDVNPSDLQPPVIELGEPFWEGTTDDLEWPLPSVIPDEWRQQERIPRPPHLYEPIYREPKLKRLPPVEKPKEPTPPRQIQPKGPFWYA